MTRLKDVAQILAGQSPPSEHVYPLEDGLPFLQGNAEFGDSHPAPRFQSPLAPRRCEIGDILVSVRAPVGAINVADRVYGIGRGLNAVRVHGADRGLIRWWLSSARLELQSLATGSTFEAITAAILGGMRIPDLMLEEQRAIADYLDRETAQIDELIAEQQRLVELLLERREAVGALYFHGSAGKRKTTVRRVLRPLARPAEPDLGVITAYRDGVVTLRSNRRDDGYTFSNTEHGYQEIRPGDLVFHALDGFAGAVGVSDSHGNATPVYHVCEAVAGDDPEYLAMLLRYLGVSGFLATQAPNVRERSVDFRNWSMLARIPLSLPSPVEQRAAVAEIKSQTARIDTLVGEAERLIELAKERRSALITAAVTGQIDVRSAS